MCCFEVKDGVTLFPDILMHRTRGKVWQGLYGLLMGERKFSSTEVAEEVHEENLESKNLN